MKFFAGIGSRETPPGVEPMIQEVCIFLHKFGYTLRSGGAPGADTKFEVNFEGEKEIYLPWKDFNKNQSDLFLDSMNSEIVYEAREIAKKHHPAWNNLSEAAKKLMTRNTFQVLGQDLKTHSQFVVCWTQGGGIKGGTGQAMRISKSLNVPIFNLFDKNSVYKLKLLINSIN